MDEHTTGDDGTGASRQAAVWEQAGRAWVEAQDTLDRLFAPVQDALLGGVDPAWREVLDVGCGTGGLTVAVAERLGEGGRATGVDISEPMLAAARIRAEEAGARAEFVAADAQRHAFEPAVHDAVVSRFGVMFFDDPVAAFANLRSATLTGGSLRLAVWRGPADNPFMTEAVRAARGLVDLPAPDPDRPGQFAFADDGRVERILADGGWHDVAVEPLDAACTMPEAALDGYLTRLGPLGLALAERDPEDRRRIVDAVRPAFARYVDGDVVRVDAACWLVTATA